MSQIHFELVSPEAKLASEPVDMAVIPATEGQIGVSGMHASLVVSLKAGVVRLYSKDKKEPRSIFIAGGFADVTAESCTVLAEEAVNVSDLDKAAIEKHLGDLEEDLSLAEEIHDKKRLELQIELERVRLEAASGALL